MRKAVGLLPSFVKLLPPIDRDRLLAQGLQNNKDAASTDPEKLVNFSLPWAYCTFISHVEQVLDIENESRSWR
jgi:hypothetical protein